MAVLTHFTEDRDSCQVVGDVTVHVTMQRCQVGAFLRCGLRLSHALCFLKAMPGIRAHLPLDGIIRTIRLSAVNPPHSRLQDLRKYNVL